MDVLISFDINAPPRPVKWILSGTFPGARSITGRGFHGPGAAFYTKGYAYSHEVGELFFAKVAPYSDTNRRSLWIKAPIMGITGMMLPSR
jgi:hypothetical protein